LTDTGFTLPQKLYDFLKWIALVVLPLVVALVLTLGQILHWEASEVIAGVIATVDTFLGSLLGKSASNYKRNDPNAVGDLVFGTDDEGNAEIKQVAVNRENPVFKAGTKVYLNVIRQVDQQ
jgi:hypothetical protein